MRIWNGSGLAEAHSFRTCLYDVCLPAISNNRIKVSGVPTVAGAVASCGIGINAKVGNKLPTLRPTCYRSAAEISLFHARGSASSVLASPVSVISPDSST